MKFWEAMKALEEGKSVIHKHESHKWGDLWKRKDGEVSVMRMSLAPTRESQLEEWNRHDLGIFHFDYEWELYEEIK